MASVSKTGDSTGRAAKKKPDRAGRIVTGVAVALLAAGAVTLAELAIRTPAFASLKEMLPAQLAWHFSRGSAIVAYLLLSGSMGWGLVLSTKISKEITPPPVALALHNAVSWAAFGLAGLHALALLLDTYFTYSVLDLLIPFTGPYKPFLVGLGIISLYGLFVTSASFAWRSWLGQKNWWRIHMLSFPLYGIATLHGFLAGTDSSQLPVRLLYLASVLAMLFLINYRLLAARRKRR